MYDEDDSDGAVDAYSEGFEDGKREEREILINAIDNMIDGPDAVRRIKGLIGHHDEHGMEVYREV